MRKPGSRDVWIAWVGLAALVFLHVWRPVSDSFAGDASEPVRLYVGWIPAELAFRLGWMALAWLYLLFFCARIWRDGD